MSATIRPTRPKPRMMTWPSSALSRARRPSCRPALAPRHARRPPPELGEQWGHGQADRRDDLPEGRRLGADQLRRGRRSQDDQRRFRRRGHQHAGFQRDAGARAPPKRSRTAVTAALTASTATSAARQLLPIRGDDRRSTLIPTVIRKMPRPRPRNGAVITSTSPRYSVSAMTIPAISAPRIGEKPTARRHQAGDDHDEQAGGEEQLGVLGPGGLGKQPRQHQPAERTAWRPRPARRSAWSQ